MRSKLTRTLGKTRKILSNVLFYIKLPVRILHIKDIVKQPTYYPEMERKTESERWKDNFRWLMKHHELNTLYTGYGLDIQNFRNPDDFISRHKFIQQRNAGIRDKQAFYGKPYNDVILVRNKYIFSAYIEATVGKKAVPATIGLMDGSQVYLNDSKEWITFENFCKNDFCYVFKAVEGTFGDGVNLIKNENGLLYYNEKEHTISEFQAYCGKSRMLIQELIVQHTDLRAFKTSCVNTVRAITIRGKSGKIELFAAFLRVGNDSDIFVDNRAKGSLAVGVDLETGRLMKYGFPHEEYGTKTEIHPLSGIRFEGYQLPYWKESVDLILNAHRQFPDIATIGWDVTMTDNGPLIVEANDGWEISGPQDTYGGLKERWNRLRNQ